MTSCPDDRKHQPWCFASDGHDICDADNPCASHPFVVPLEVDGQGDLVLEILDSGTAGIPPGIRISTTEAVEALALTGTEAVIVGHALLAMAELIGTSR